MSRLASRTTGLATISLSVGLSIGLLSGCAQTPSNFVVAPKILNQQPMQAEGQAIDLLCYDQRQAKHVMSVHKDYGNEPAAFYPSATDLNQQICNELGFAWQSQGFNITADAPVKVQVLIQQMQVDVQQSRTRYQADSKVALQVRINQSNSQLSQPFSGSARSSGLLTADVATLERDFNQLLGQVLNDIAQSPQLTNALK